MADAAAAALAELRVKVDLSPSSFAAPNIWPKFQYPVGGGGAAFACFRPFVGPPSALPASLVSPVFGRFLDDTGASLASLGRCDMESNCLMRLLEIMPRHHNREKTLQDEVNAVFSTLLGGEVVVFKPSEASSATTDGGLFERVHGMDVLVALIEYKKDAFSSSCDPQFQMLREVQMFWEAPERDCCSLHASDTCPVLLIEVAGPLMRVSAAATLLANRVQSEPLTPFLHMLYVRDQPQHMCRLLAVLRAIRNAVGDLRIHYKARDFELRDECAPHRTFRDACLIIPYPLRTSGTFSNVAALSNGKLLYVATQQPSGTRVCVKFSRHAYGVDVHKLWASARLAPQLLEHAVLPGGLHQVVMELLHPSDGWMMLNQVDEGQHRSVLDVALAELKRAHLLTLPNGHKTAHGDCRHVNVLVRQSSETGSSWEVRFVDFDGAGAEGQRLYPPFMSPRITWPVGALAGVPLIQSHDIELLSMGP